jgi:hypothetical protein
MTNAPSSESLLRWTYAGALDDMVVWHPWPKIKVGRQSLHERLAYSVVAGTPFLLNDGYLVLNEACVKSLEDEHSPLRVLLNAGYVRVLSRTPSRHFEHSSATVRSRRFPATRIFSKTNESSRPLSRRSSRSRTHCGPGDTSSTGPSKT